MNVFSKFKEAKVNDLKIPITISDFGNYYIGAVSNEMDNLNNFIELASNWREIYKTSFFSEFKQNIQGTKSWVKNLIEDDNRILFALTNDQEFFGHIGFEYIPSDHIIEIGYILRFKDNPKGLITTSIQTLSSWIFNETKVKTIFLNVFSCNIKAIKIYENCGFVLARKKIFYLKSFNDGSILWLPKHEEKLAETVLQEIYEMHLNKCER
ncbi:MAG: N-acetyltransferase [Stygiobacter sp.]|nr:MAG: N-acetyltransferase [Stygiobacter sp.]